MRVIAWCLVVLFFATPAFAQRTVRSWWDRTPVATSRFYRIKTDLPRADARRYGRHLDRMYEEYSRRLAELPPRGPEHLDVFIFQSEKDYVRTMRLQWGIEATGSGGMFFVNPQGRGLAFYTGGLPTPRIHHVIQHEGFHQFAYSRFGTDLPPWVNEGLAELFGEAVLVDDRLILGQSTPDVIEMVRDAVEVNEAIPFERMFLATDGDWHGLVKDGRAGLHYAQSWSMVHFLVYADDGRYRGPFERYLKLLNNAVPPDAAWVRAFGDDVAGFEQRWRDYAAVAMPSAFVTALQRIVFLAEGVRSLSRDRIVPGQLEALSVLLADRGFQHPVDGHGHAVMLRATDPVVFTIPADERNLAVSRFLLTPPGRRRLSRQEQLFESAVPTPCSIATAGMEPYDVAVTWVRDEETGDLDYRVDVTRRRVDTRPNGRDLPAMVKSPADIAAEIDGHWDYHDPVASEVIFREQIAAALSGADLERQTQLLTQIGRALGLQRRFGEAHTVLDDVETRLVATSPLARVRARLERGRTYNSQQQKDAARPLFEEAYALATDHGEEFYAIDAAHMIAIVADPDESITWNERAIAAAEAARDERARGWRGSLCNNLGWTYHGQGDFTRALEFFETALAARREQAKPADIRVAEWCKARCLRSLERYDEALAIQRRLAGEHAAAGTDDGYVEEELAEILHALGRTEEARPHFKRAHELLSKDPWLVENEPERVARLGAMGG